VAVELARCAPQRCLAVVLDGLPPFPTPSPGVEPFVPTLDGAHVARQWGRRRLELTFTADGAPREVDLAAELPLGLHEAVLDELDAGDRYRRSLLAAAAHDPGPALSAIAVAAMRPSVPFVRPVEVGSDPARRRARIVELVAGLATGGAPPPASVPTPGPRLASAFATTQWGQVAVRHGAPDGSDARPLVMLHASPLAGELLLPLAEAVLATRPVIVVDTLGNGDSDKPDTAAHPQFRAPRVDDYAQVVLAALDDLGVGEYDVHGAHSGAVIAMEVSIAAPERVRRLVLDGIPLFTPADVDELFGEYTIDLTPRADGSHLLAAWWNTADVLTWFPWFRRDPAHRRGLPRPDPWQLHRRFVQMARSGASYPLSHHAVAVHPVRDRLPLVAVPTLLARSPGDPLGTVTAACAALVPDATVLPFTDDPATNAATLEAWLSHGRRTRAG
jgi:pimeloyl-ACP methyl ester carboxylesterase